MNNLQLRWAEWRANQAELPFYRKTGFLAAAIFVGIVMVAGIVLLLGGRDGNDSPPGNAASETAEQTVSASSSDDEEATTSPGTGDPPTAPPVAGGDCPALDSASGEDALTVAPEVEWSPVGDAPTATSAQDGPAITEGPMRCYSKTAAGALLAAHNFAAEQNDGLIPLIESVEARVAPQAPIYDELVSDAQSEGTRGGTPIAPTGYRFLNAAEDEYTVAIVYQLPTGSESAYLEFRTVVRWINGDWMIWDHPGADQLASLPAGYLEWGPYVGAEE